MASGSGKSNTVKRKPLKNDRLGINTVENNSAENNSSKGVPYHFAGGELILRLHIQPGAGRTGWGGLHGGAEFKLRVAAPPVEGKANQACLRFLAKAAGVPKGAVTLVRGERSRSKVVRIAPLDEKRFQALKAQWNSF